jgi:hypothetical protein
MSFSIEFWVGAGIAVFLGVVGLAVGIGMDAQTKNEFRFVVGCFLASAAIVVYGIEMWQMTVTWTAPWRLLSAFVLFALVLTGTGEAIRWAYGRHVRSTATPMRVEADHQSAEAKPAPEGVLAPKVTSVPVKPPITIEQHSSGPESPNVATFGNNSPVTITKKPNPYVPVIYYEFNGAKHVQQGASGEVILGDEYMIFPRFGQLEAEQKWQELLDACEQQIGKSPEWLTPYLFAGVAYANLGQKDRAIKLLEHVEKQAGGNKDYYEDASRILRILKELTQQ